MVEIVTKEICVCMVATVAIVVVITVVIVIIIVVVVIVVVVAVVCRSVFCVLFSQCLQRVFKGST